MAKSEAKSDVTGSVWKIVTKVGDRLSEGDTLMIIESMKMEIPVIVEEAGRLTDIVVKEGEPVGEGQVVALLETNRA